MAGLFQLQIKGGVSSARAIDLFIEGMDTEEILDGAAAIFLNRIRTRYQQQTAPDGTRWTPSAAAIAEQRNTGIDTGNLFRSIQLYESVEGRRVIGTDVFYGPYFHYGSKKKRNPGRHFMAYNDDDLDLVTNFILSRFA